MCAAVTSLVRTVSKVVAGAEGVEVEGDAAEEGALSFRIKNLPALSAGRRDWLRGASEVLLRGIADLAEDNPDEVHLTLEQSEGS